MSNITIFEETTNVETVRRQSKYADKMGSGPSMRRIGLSNARTFKRIVGGEQIGKAPTGSLEVIIVDWLKEPSRKFYAAAYDKDAKATLPDCWANNGDKPEEGAANPQNSNCAVCPKNVKGSGANGKGKACRYERRLAVLVVGDSSGDIYQITIPSTSLFSDNVGNEYGFEGYMKFLRANNEAMDTVVTRIIYDEDSDIFKVRFKATRHLTAVEGDLIDAAQEDPESKRYTMLTNGSASSAPRLEAPTPVAAIAAAPKAAAANPFGDEDEGEDEVEAAPTKRPSKPKAAVAEVKPELAQVLTEWLDGDDDEEA